MRTKIVLLTISVGLIYSVHAEVDVINAEGWGSAYAEAGTELWWLVDNLEDPVTPGPDPQSASYNWDGPVGAGDSAVHVAGERYSEYTHAGEPAYAGAAAAAQSTLLKGNQFVGRIDNSAYGNGAYSYARAESYYTVEFELNQPHSYLAEFSFDYWAERGNRGFAVGELLGGNLPLLFFAFDIGDVGPPAFDSFEGMLEPGIYTFNINNYVWIEELESMPHHWPHATIDFSLSLAPVPESASTLLLFGPVCAALWALRRLSPLNRNTT